MVPKEENIYSLGLMEKFHQALFEIMEGDDFSAQPIPKMVVPRSEQT